MRILFITATRIGDAVLSTGLLDHIIRTWPQAKIVIACGPVAEGVFARMPNRAWTILLTKRRLRLHWLELWREVGLERWDMVVDLRGSAFAWLVRAKRRVVMRGGRQPGPRLGHLGALFNLDPPPLPVAWFNAADRSRAAMLLASDGNGADGKGGEGRWIGLGPTANWDRKVWPAERFVALFEALVAPGQPLEGARAVILGGPGPQEAAMAAPVLAALGDRAVSLMGSVALPEAAAVLARCAIFIGNDSGLMHLSAAAGTPTLGLFGPSRVGEYAPSGRRTATAIAPGSPALDSMAGLTLDQALTAAQSLLTRGLQA